ncbi:M23 family metallopeptidase [Pseudoclavibacter sp. VKM Ac-2888]|uniref:M23 family metallopeptidase n=1 Tax=Pseudoclavibacter sp. VKM Ac-2888 TaxID=2783830 RepID=UPI00188C4FE5|nr:M23 family metallopeptidase [Pseudoclavibacter sp. VKM Ac-2888]MBF4549317.1 M23 family metallopeptidase [Pseudoclavibacter sp. VKM Ac-2888]
MMSIPALSITAGVLLAASVAGAAISGTLQESDLAAPVVDGTSTTTGETYTVPASAALGAFEERASSSIAVSTTASGVQWPIDLTAVTITDGFGPRVAPCDGCSTNHRGLDFAGPAGTRIGSIAAGTVVDVVPVAASGLGTHVVVEHQIDGQKVQSVYAHLTANSTSVAIGDNVTPGQLLGFLGNTGSSTGPHLHLEVLVAGTHVDPKLFLEKYADGKPVDIFGNSPDWAPDTTDNTIDDSWTPERSSTYQPPVAPVPAAPTPGAPAPAAPASPTTTTPEAPTPPSPSTPTPPTVEPTPPATDEPTETAAPEPAPSEASPTASTAAAGGE